MVAILRLPRLSVDRADGVALAPAARLGRAAAQGFTPEELERAKRLWWGRRRARLSTPTQLALIVATQLESGRTFKDEGALADRVRALDLASVAAAARGFVDESAMRFSFVGPG